MWCLTAKMKTLGVRMEAGHEPLLIGMVFIKNKKKLLYIQNTQILKTLDAWRMSFQPRGANLLCRVFGRYYTEQKHTGRERRHEQNR